MQFPTLDLQRHRRRRLLQVVHECRQRPTVLAGEQRLPAQLRARAGQLRQPFVQAALLGLVQQRCERCRHPLPPIRNTRLARDSSERLQAGGGTGAAQRKFETAHGAQPFPTPIPLRHQRVGQGSDKRHRRSEFRRQFRQRQEHPPRRRLRQGLSGGIVGCDVPAAQVLDDTPGKAAIGCHDGSALFRLCNRFAHKQRNGLRLVFQSRGFKQADTGKAAPVGRQIDPGAGRFGRQEQAGDRVRTLRRPRRVALAVPLRELAARYAHAVQQQLEVILRVGDGIAAAERSGVSAFVRGPGAAQLIPYGIVHRQVEVRQDDGTARQPADDAQQPRQRRRGAGDTGGDDRRGGRIGFPHARGVIEQRVAARGGIGPPKAFQLRAPCSLRGVEELCRGFPVACLLLDRIEHGRLPQRIGSDILHQQAIHRLRRLPRKPQQGRRSGNVAAQPGKHVGQQVRQRQHSRGRIDGGGDLGRAERIEERTERLVQVQVADDRHARQQQPGLTRSAVVTHERLGHGAARAGGGKQQRQPRKAEAVLPVPGHQPGDQRIRETAMRRDRIEAGPLARRRLALRFALPCPLPVAVTHPATPPAWERSRRACPLRTIRR